MVFAVTQESIGRAVLSEAVRLTMDEEAERQTEMFLRGEIKIKPTFRKMKGERQRRARSEMIFHQSFMVFLES